MTPNIPKTPRTAAEVLARRIGKRTSEAFIAGLIKHNRDLSTLRGALNLVSQKNPELANGINARIESMKIPIYEKFSKMTFEEMARQIAQAKGINKGLAQEVLAELRQRAAREEMNLQQWGVEADARKREADKIKREMRMQQLAKGISPKVWMEWKRKKEMETKGTEVPNATEKILEAALQTIRKENVKTFNAINALPEQLRNIMALRLNSSNIHARKAVAHLQSRNLLPKDETLRVCTIKAIINASRTAGVKKEKLFEGMPELTNHEKNQINSILMSHGIVRLHGRGWLYINKQLK